MNYQEAVINEMRAQTAALITISQQLERIERLVAPQGPNYTRPLKDFGGFNWDSIGATVTGRDRDGVSRVDWLGRTFTRRSGGGKFGQAIWFSRYVGEDEAGQKKYARLITFKDYSDAEGVPETVAHQAR